MAWNEKHARKTSSNNLPNKESESDYKRKLDEEACREGDAMRFFNKNDVKPQLGRRIAKQSRDLDGARATMSHKAGNAEAKDNAAATAKYVTAAPRELKQG